MFFFPPARLGQARPATKVPPTAASVCGSCFAPSSGRVCEIRPTNHEEWASNKVRTSTPYQTHDLI